MTKRSRAAMGIASLFVGAVSLAAQSTPSATSAAEPPQLGALARANLAKPHPKAPFDLTGTWQHGGGQNNGFRFTPPPGTNNNFPTQYACMDGTASGSTTLTPGLCSNDGGVWYPDLRRDEVLFDVDLMVKF